MVSTSGQRQAEPVHSTAQVDTGLSPELQFGIQEKTLWKQWGVIGSNQWQESHDAEKDEVEGDDVIE